MKQPFPCILPSKGRTTVPMGYKTSSNPDINLPLLAKHLVDHSKGPSHPGGNKPTRHRGLSLWPPSQCANKSQSGKCHRFLGFLHRICAWLLSLPSLLPPPLLPTHTSEMSKQNSVSLFLMGTTDFWKTCGNSWQLPDCKYSLWVWEGFVLQS